MKPILFSLLGMILMAGQPALSEIVELSPAEVAAITAQSQKKAEEKPSPEKIVSQVLDCMQKACQLLEGVKDRESADKAAKQMESIKKDIFKLKHLSEKLSDADQEKVDKDMSASERFEQVGAKGMKEQERLEEARYYGSSALKDVMESDEDPNEENPSGNSDAVTPSDNDALLPPLP